MFMDNDQINTLRSATLYSEEFESAYLAYLALEKAVKIQAIEEGKKSGPEYQLYQKVSGMLDERFPGVDLREELGLDEEGADKAGDDDYGERPETLFESEFCWMHR